MSRLSLCCESTSVERSMHVPKDLPRSPPPHSAMMPSHTAHSTYTLQDNGHHVAHERSANRLITAIVDEGAFA
jgi:hypothetical protein